ncbi:Spc98 family-domain-containing protein [Suillus subaureus]|uniref:Spindle pole body component n=1 Tax=Suillus subaureus TaxID=48587 RepID=A0A9P7JBJ8_9AGAM|nr:Spc98 family-domain-containing protein [Suillus subaureus]KAG1813510.1 Spc98 family-domain-containing protein [Suillus subaureus]
MPPLLEGWKYKFLLAGKYLTVIRECGIKVQAGQKMKSVHEDESFTNSSKTRMRTRIALPYAPYGKINSSYLGSALSSTLPMKKPAKGVSVEEDTYRVREDVRVLAHPKHVIDALTLDYNVKFPLLLVISRKMIWRYQFLSRFLLYLKHVEQSFATMWTEQKTSPWRRLVPNMLEFEQWGLRIALLRARMLAFVQQILAFTTIKVLEPNWRALETKLAKVDRLLRDHIDFLDTCLKECVLTSAKLLRRFVESRSHLNFGLVNHALCAAVRDILKDYQTLLSQLEHAFNTSPQFSLQKLWFYVHPTVHTLSLIYQLILELATTDDDNASSSSESDPEQTARDEALGLGGARLRAVLSDMKKSTSDAPINVKGGEVLTVIYERMQTMSGDPTAVKVYGTLLTAAGVPYVEMLRVWTTTGRLEDPYEELCVKESSKGILEVDHTDEYLGRRYTVIFLSE